MREEMQKILKIELKKLLLTTKINGNISVEEALKLDSSKPIDKPKTIPSENIVNCNLDAPSEEKLPVLSQFP